MVVWDINPIALKIGPLQIHWYGIFFATGLLLAYLLGEWIFKKEKKESKLLEPLFLYIVIGIVVGARLFHVLFYDPIYFLHHPLEIFQVWKGGLASHGGAIGALLGVYFFSRKYNINFWWLFARAMPSTFILAAFIRIGNFFNSEIVGTKTSVPWGVIFTRKDDVIRHPVVIYESISYLIIFLITVYLYKKMPKEQFTKTVPGLAISLAFAIRFILEFFKTSQAEFASYLPLSMGQILSIPFIIGGIFLIIYQNRNV